MVLKDGYAKHILRGLVRSVVSRHERRKEVGSTVPLHDIFDHMSLTDEEYLATLKRNRNRIANSLPLVAINDQCSWGLCSRDSDLWNDKNMHIPSSGGNGILPKFLGPGHKCPMDARKDGGDHCVENCRVFQPSVNKKWPHGSVPDRGEALALYDVEISRMEGKK